MNELYLKFIKTKGYKNGMSKHRSKWESKEGSIYFNIEAGDYSGCVRLDVDGDWYYNVMELDINDLTAFAQYRKLHNRSQIIKSVLGDNKQK